MNRETSMSIPIAELLETCRVLLSRELAKLPLSKPTLDVQVGPIKGFF